MYMLFILEYSRQKKKHLSRYFLRHHFFVEQVFTPNIVYKGQNLMKAVSNNTTPTILIYLSPPSITKYNDIKMRPKIILTILSVVPTFAFILHNSFL